MSEVSKQSKQRLYYLNNIDTIKAKNIKYYHDNKAERQIYNTNYWALHKQKYLKQRSEDIIYKTNQRLYYQSYRENKKHIYTVDCIDKNLQDIKLQDKKPIENITVTFKFAF